MRRRKNILLKELWVEMKKSWPRFLSILAMVFLGTAFFSGITATGSDMQRSADSFYDETSLMDIRVYGDLGLTKEDVGEIQKIEGVQIVEGRYTVDVFWEADGESRPVKLMSQSEQMDFVTLMDGRLPNQSGECLLDERLAEVYGCKAGDLISIKSGTEDALEDTISCDTYKVVGLCDSSYYLSHERGTTSIGNGELKGFLVVPKEDFAPEVFTEITILTEGTKDLNCYSDEYEEKVDEIKERIEAIAGGRCDIRYNEIREEAEGKIADGEKEIADAEKELADAEKELQDAREELEDSKKKIAESKKELNDGEKELVQNEKELKNAKKKIADGKKQIADGKEEIQKAKEELLSVKAELDKAKEELDHTEDSLIYLPEEQQIYVKQQLEIGKNEYEAGLFQYNAGLQAVEDNERQLSTEEKNLLEAEKELISGEKELAKGREELEKGKKELKKAEKELVKAEAKLADAEDEFEEKSADAKKDIKKAKKKLADAKEDIEELEVPEWYVLDRGSIQTYVEFEQDGQRISSLGKVVPILFFLVAALVCLTTMTRMVGADRTQIGVLKALGYEKSQINMKYMVYALSSTMIGTIGGVTLGQKLLPYIIMNAYSLLYENLPGFLMPIHASYTIISFIVAVGCIFVATVSACNKTLKEVPANLMRPVAPKAGKKILLERVGFIWNHLNFSQKAAVRNLMRYKKRLIMTVFGIGGCMALLITGFGIEDSIMSIGDLQYGYVQLYDGNITIDKDANEEDRNELIQIVEKDDRIKEYVYVREAAVDVSAGEKEESAYFLVPKDTKTFETFVSLTERKNGIKHSIGEEGVIINEKLASLLDVSAGDTISLQEGNDKAYDVKVIAVVQNYFNHYVYMSPVLYEKIHGEEPEYQNIYMIQTANDKETEGKLREDYMNLSMVSGISFISDANENITEMLKSMDTIIIVIVAAAGMLAFVVLYNLNNINIGERKRELATLKVLGFYDIEVSAYIFRENVILTILGMIAGVGLGILLHRFVILTVETDILMFGREISLLSFVYSIGFTFLFSLIVNGFMHFKMKKIDMIESLKSVE